tara:strand:+ start:1684 stop:1929 length:246 start_codon:yes stop_codon:yes gene_type:complete
VEKQKILSIIISILGIIIVVDSFLAEFFNIGVKQDTLVAGYCIAFVLISIKFPDILKSKLVIIPMYIIVLQTLYSLVITYI